MIECDCRVHMDTEILDRIEALEIEYKYLPKTEDNEYLILSQIMPSCLIGTKH